VTEEEKSLPQLPEGWTYTTIRELSFLVTKGSTPTTYGFNYAPEGINFVKVENIQNGRINKQSIIEFITEEAYDFLKRSQLVEKDVLFSIAGTIGRVGIVTGDDLPANINQAIAIIRCPWDFLYPRYLGLFLDSPMARSSMEKRPRGVGMKNIGLEDVKEISVPLPPFNEQSRIVGKVEELFSFLDAGVGSLRKVQAQLKRYRQAVLKYAFEGKLTEEWRKTHKDQIKSAQKLLECIEQELKNKGKYKGLQPFDTSDLPDLPEDWVWTRLGDIGDVAAGGTPSTDYPENFDGNIPWITPSDLSGFTGKFISKGRRNLSEEGLNSSSAVLLPKGTVLFSSRAPIGYVVIATNPVSTNQGFKNLTCCEGIFNEYVFYYLKSSKRLAESYGSGTTFKEVSASKFARIPIPLAPLPEQQRIVEEIESRLSETDETEKIVEQSIRLSERLRQSILKTAFEGRLVPQDPTDEPADKLLERIKKEKVKSKAEGSAGNNRKKSITNEQVELSRYVK
jgi:type I restriction enzyme S subunit